MDYLQQIEKAIAYIEDNLENDLTVADVADSVSYSCYHFHRMFEAFVGESIGGYIRSRRLSKATEYLLYSDKRIIDIAVLLRFESHESFGRAFKTMFHTTPSQYRKNGIDTLIGRKKPLDSLSLHHRQSISLEPEIVILPAMNLVGLRFPIRIVEASTIDEKWAEFASSIPEIQHASQSMDRYCLYEAHENCSRDMLDAKVETTAFLGIEVTDNEGVPPGFCMKYFSGGKYAHFVHTGTTASLLDTYRYIWGTWIPYNKVELAQNDDIERYTKRFLGIHDQNSETDIYLPIL